MFENLTKYLDDGLMELDRKAASGMLEMDDLHIGDMMAHFAKSLDTHVAMQEAGGGYSRADRMYYGSTGDTSMRARTNRGGYSYADGNRRGYPMIREGGYSRADRMDEVVQAMSGAMSDMPEDLRREAQRFLTKMQNQM